VFSQSHYLLLVLLFLRCRPRTQRYNGGAHCNGCRR
jgi:hypothetical protein